MEAFTKVNSRIHNLETEVVSLRATFNDHEHSIRASHKATVAIAQTVKKHQAKLQHIEAHEQLQEQHQMLSEDVEIIATNAERHENNLRILHNDYLTFRDLIDKHTQSICELQTTFANLPNLNVAKLTLRPNAQKPESQTRLTNNINPSWITTKLQHSKITTITSSPKHPMNTKHSRIS
jgi:chromosome segregation ATPase